MKTAGRPAVVPMTVDDWPAVRAVYAEGIATGHATFETEPPSWEVFDATRSLDHRLVALDPAITVLGWCAVSPVSQRSVHAGVVEHSIYVAAPARGRDAARPRTPSSRGARERDSPASGYRPTMTGPSPLVPTMPGEDPGVPPLDDPAEVEATEAAADSSLPVDDQLDPASNAVEPFDPDDPEER